MELEIIKVEEEALILSKRKIDALKAWDDLELKFENGDVFEAEVKDVVKGGLVASRRTWFCSSFSSRRLFR